MARFIVGLATIHTKRPVTNRCWTEHQTKRLVRVRCGSVQQGQVAGTRPCSLKLRGGRNHWRPAKESTIRSVDHPVGGQSGKPSMRLQLRVMQALVSAFIVNVRYRRELVETATENLGFWLLLGFQSQTSGFHGQSVRRVRVVARSRSKVESFQPGPACHVCPTADHTHYTSKP